ncbi:MAG TPA: universal stress protein [Deltaproteobacteria bacterium]|jgi:nucleotide-binding universal stress UspA family protein|nr:universal stress protein [Deltaproteobacteria bacterium]HOI05585.1 universal stress protein [Deltaproteobacteria bacterium]
MFEPKKILVPTDFSEHSDKALREALDIAERYNSQIYLLHVIDQNIQQCVVDYCLPQETVDQLERESENKSREMMQEEVAKVAPRRAVEINYDIKRGVPYDVILKEEDDKNVDLIVIASRGKDGLIGHLMGNVADRVSERAKSEVLIVKT